MSFPEERNWKTDQNAGPTTPMWHNYSFMQISVYIPECRLQRMPIAHKYSFMQISMYVATLYPGWFHLFWTCAGRFSQLNDFALPPCIQGQFHLFQTCAGWLGEYVGGRCIKLKHPQPPFVSCYREVIKARCHWWLRAPQHWTSIKETNIYRSKFIYVVLSLCLYMYIYLHYLHI